MGKFRIKHALGGGFGGIENQEWEIIDADSLDKAMDEARQKAIEEYQSMEGMHGLKSVAEIMEEDDLSAEEAESVYEDEMESWLDFTAEQLSDDGEEEESDE